MTVTTMTLREAEQVIREWQTKLAQAQAALAVHEQNLGLAALQGNAQAAAHQLHKLETDVKIAAQALEAAKAQREPVRRSERAEHAKQLRAQAKELREKSDEAERVYLEFEPRVTLAHNQMFAFLQQALLLETNAAEIEQKLSREEQPNE